MIVLDGQPGVDDRNPAGVKPVPCPFLVLGAGHIDSERPLTPQIRTERPRTVGVAQEGMTKDVLKILTNDLSQRLAGRPPVVSGHAGNSVVLEVGDEFLQPVRARRKGMG